jgi:hypothetical protein
LANPYSHAYPPRISFSAPPPTHAALPQSRKVAYPLNGFLASTGLPLLLFSVISACTTISVADIPADRIADYL